MAISTILREISNLIYKKIRAAENTMNFFLLADLAMKGYIWHRWRLYDNFLSGSTEQISYSFLVSTSTHYAQHHVFFKFQSTHYYFLILYGFLRNKLRHRNRKKRWGDLSKYARKFMFLTITNLLWWIKSWKKNIKLPDNLAI